MKKFLRGDPVLVDVLGVDLDLEEVLGQRSWSFGCPGVTLDLEDVFGWKSLSCGFPGCLS